MERKWYINRDKQTGKSGCLSAQFTVSICPNRGNSGCIAGPGNRSSNRPHLCNTDPTALQANTRKCRKWIERRPKNEAGAELKFI